MWKYLFWMCLFCFLGCATKSPAPLDDESSVLAINVGVGFHSNLTTFDCFRPEIVYFIKLDADNNIMSDDLIESTMNVEAWWGDNFIGRNTTYLFNLKPGKYAAVAAYGYGYISNGNVIYLFSEEMIRSSIVEVKTGSFVYMGAFLSEQGSLFKRFDTADNIQKFYFNKLSSIYKEHGGLLSGHLFSEEYFYIATPLKEKFVSKEYKQKFLESQLKDFRGTEWEYLIKKEINALE